MSTVYNDFMAAGRRRTILELLEKVPSYCTNEIDIKRGLLLNRYAVDTETLRHDLRFLHDRDLIITDQPSGVWVAQLTSKGNDVVQGSLTVDGVARQSL